MKKGPGQNDIVILDESLDSQSTKQVKKDNQHHRACSHVVQSDTPKHMEEPTFQQLLEKADELLNDDKSSLLTYEISNEQGLSSEQGQSVIPVIRQNSGPIEVAQLKEMQLLFAQLEDLRHDVQTLEENKVDKQKQQHETMMKISELFKQAEKTNQEFKDIPSTVQTSKDEKEEEINEDLLN